MTVSLFTVYNITWCSSVFLKAELDFFFISFPGIPSRYQENQTDDYDEPEPV